METADAGARVRPGLDSGLALILVGEADRRVLPALMLAARLPELEPRALHIAVDPEESRRLSEAWMALDLSWVPLHVVEPEDETPRVHPAGGGGRSGGAQPGPGGGARGRS